MTDATPSSNDRVSDQTIADLYEISGYAQVTGKLLRELLDEIKAHRASAHETPAPQQTIQQLGWWQCPCCQNYYTPERLVCPVSGDSRPSALKASEYCPDGERHKWSVPVRGAKCVRPGCNAVNGRPQP